MKEQSCETGKEDKTTYMKHILDIYEATSANQQLADDITSLLAQLSTRPHPFTLADLQAIAGAHDTRLYIATVDGKTVGMLTIVYGKTPTGKKAWIEDVVVDRLWRGKSIGRRLVDIAAIHAHDNGASQLLLTTRPERVAANALYRSLGFEQKKTNVYNMDFETHHSNTDIK